MYLGLDTHEAEKDNNIHRAPLVSLVPVAVAHAIHLPRTMFGAL